MFIFQLPLGRSSFEENQKRNCFKFVWINMTTLRLPPSTKVRGDVGGGSTLSWKSCLCHWPISPRERGGQFGKGDTGPRGTAEVGTRACGGVLLFCSCSNDNGFKLPEVIPAVFLSCFHLYHKGTSATENVSRVQKSFVSSLTPLLFWSQDQNNGHDFLKCTCDRHSKEHIPD